MKHMRRRTGTLLRASIAAWLMIGCAGRGGAKDDSAQPAVAGDERAGRGPQDPAPGAATASRCLEDVRAHALGEARKVSRDRVVRLRDMTEAPLSDVDDDGQPEQLFIDEYSGTANALHLLYLSGEGCVRFGGVFWAAAESVEALPAEGKRGQLRIFKKGGCAGLEGKVAFLAWKEGELRSIHEIECSCPDTDPGAERDPACPSLS